MWILSQISQLFPHVLLSLSLWLASADGHMLDPLNTWPMITNITQILSLRSPMSPQSVITVHSCPTHNSIHVHGLSVENNHLLLIYYDLWIVVQYMGLRYTVWIHITVIPYQLYILHCFLCLSFFIGKMRIPIRITSLDCHDIQWVNAKHLD